MVNFQPQIGAPWLTLIGIGEDGLIGLSDAARQAIITAPMLWGGARHLALLPAIPGQIRQPWPHPFALAYEQILAQRGTPVCILASGDPMFYGIGGRLTEYLPINELRILPAPSACSIAAARLGWSLQDVRIIAAHGRPLETVLLYLAPGVRLFILSENGQTPNRLAQLLTTHGFGPSRLIVLEYLGGPREQQREATATTFSEHDCADLNIIALECHAEPVTSVFSRLAGLPDTAYNHDGQLTKRDVRAITLARLAPSPGELLWDVGAGCGSIGIEWLRADVTCRSIAIESDAARCCLIEKNCWALGVPNLQLITGHAPEILIGLAAPDAIFIGGGLTTPGLLASCWQALKPGGRLVANTVTLQGESLLVDWQQRHGGDLTHITLAHAAPLGRFNTWRPALPITLLTISKPGSPKDCYEH